MVWMNRALSLTLPGGLSFYSFLDESCTANVSGAAPPVRCHPTAHATQTVVNIQADFSLFTRSQLHTELTRFSYSFWSARAVTVRSELWDVRFCPFWV